MAIDFRFSMTTTSNQFIITGYGNTPTECKEKNELLSPVKNLESIVLRDMRVKR